jgi:hypothetical protein
VLVVQNSARSMQLRAGRSSCPLPLPFAQRKSEFLIANLELEFRPSPRKQTTAAKPNRKYSAISCPEIRRGSNFLSSRHLSLATGFLIENARLEFAVNSRNQSSLQISNRERNRVSQTAFVSDPLSSAPNLAIIDFPTRGHL